MYIDAMVGKLTEDEEIKQRVVHHEVIPPKGAVYGTLMKELPEPLERYLARFRLYRHQCQVIDRVRDGGSVIITTPTASGKTLAFNLPVFERLMADKNATALYLYPTKALSNDQLKTLREMGAAVRGRFYPEIYDGDTPQGKRPKIRERSRIVITNPYELHQIMSWHYKWDRFLSHVQYVVVDEAHTYRGVFGSNIAFLLRRLRRLFQYYGSSPVFILSSATIANPLEFARKLTGLDFEVVSEDCSPRGRKHFIFYNPYYDGTGKLSTHQETRDLFTLSVKNGLQTLCFTTSRKMAELIAIWSREELKKAESPLAERVASYRAGYLPGERREIEDRLKSGELKGVTTTDALELGIDIGSLDSVVISGFPGTVISTWQQAGRAGRSHHDDSLVSLVAFQNPLDQYLMNHPESFFQKPFEHAIIDLGNPYIRSGHILCAAAELPLDLEKDVEYFGDTGEMLKDLEDNRILRETEDGWVYCGKARATDIVSLDGIPSEVFKIMRDGRLIETIDRGRAFREAHKGAVFLHQGEPHIVRVFDLETGVILVDRFTSDYFTDAVKTSDIHIREGLKRKKLGEYTLFFGRVRVKEQYTGYKIKKYDQVVGWQPLELPPLEFESTAIWFTLPQRIADQVKQKQRSFGGGLHGVEHAMIGIMPFHVMCDRWDIGGVSFPYNPETLKPTVFIYDGFEGGIGLSEKAFELFADIVRMTRQQVRDCRCDDGCPGCILSPKCGNNNRPMDKQAAAEILADLEAQLHQAKEP
ncbi:MAG: DEAD/DEAH box helicase [Firmicutes bacterium]|nr:DEAD/DEAH box helicase [Bacillota bacterium]